MKSILLVATILLSCLMLQAAYINASGTIAANTTWSGVDSVRVTGNITVNNGVTLTINPGIRVAFQGHYSLNVNGRLLAVGNAANKITFTANNHTVGWDRIRFDHTPATNDSSKVVYCTLEYGRANATSAEEYGGALYSYNFGKLLISNCTFQNNTSTTNGGALAVCLGSNVMIANSVFTDNYAGSGGGAIFLQSNATLKNLLICNNSIDNTSNGGGIMIISPMALLTNCTITNNSGGGVKLVSQTDPVFRNCIVYGNNPEEVDIYDPDDSPNPDFYYCDIEGGLARLNWLGTFNPVGYTGDFQNSIDTNPQFVGSGLNPYDLQATSPCINTGDPATTAGTVGLYDIGGGNRIINGRVDMGVYEELKPADTVAGNCLAFDGVTDNVTGSGIRTTLSAFTIETWVYHNTLPGTVQRYITLSPEMAVLRYDGTIYGGYRSLHFYIKKANGTGLGVRADSILVTGEWMHIAGTYNGTNLKLYVNGRLVKSAVSAGAGLYAPSGAYNFSASGETFNGKLDETRLWNYVRTETQIRENMYHPLTGGETGLLNYWQFNAGSGTTVLDIAGGCNGTMNSMTDASWTGSGIPFGTGSAYSAVEAPGGVDFPGVDLSANYTVQHGAQVTAAVIRGQSLPIIAEDVVFDSQYWILDNFGSLGFVTSLTFHPVEDLSGYANITGEFRLYHRASTSGGAFTLYRAGANLNAAANTVTFGNVDTDGQFVIAYNEPDFLAAPQNVQIVVNGNTVHLSWDAVPNANVYNVYASDDPYAPQAVWRILALRHPATTWDVPIEAQAEFYKVVASDAGVVLE